MILSKQELMESIKFIFDFLGTEEEVDVELQRLCDLYDNVLKKHIMEKEISMPISCGKNASIGNILYWSKFENIEEIVNYILKIENEYDVF